MSWIDILIILMFVAYAVSAGFRSKSKASEGPEEYFLAGRTLKGWQAGLSMAATQFAADTPLLVTGLIATAGIFSLWQMWIYALAFLLMGFLFSPQWRRARVITDAEFTEIRYGGKLALGLRVAKAIYFGTIFNCIVLGWVLFAAAKIAEPFLLWDLWLPQSLFDPVLAFVQWVDFPLSNLSPSHPDLWRKTASNLISLITIVTVSTLYSTTGGLRSVVKTDIMQFAVMMIGTFLFTYIVVQTAGGFDAIYEQILIIFAGSQHGVTAQQVLAFTPWDAKDASFAIISLFALQWILQLNSDGTGYLAQRSMACRSDRDSKVAGVVFTVVQILLRSLLWIPLGLGLLVLFPMDMALSPELRIAERESTYVRGIAELLPPGIMGIMVTAMLAALASTLDTHLNWGSSYWTNDIYKHFICKTLLKREPSRKSVMIVARSANILILCLALFVMTQLTSIQDAWRTSLLIGAGLGPVLILRWLWWRTNAWSEVCAILVSAVFAPLLLIYFDDMALRLLLIGGMSLFVSVAAAYIAGPEDLELLKKFYLRVRPAGFWGPLAGERNRRDQFVLWRALGATFFASLTIFCFLVGFGSWIARSPVPYWFPVDWAWVPSLLLIGTAAIPVWIRLGFKEDRE